MHVRIPRGRALRIFIQDVKNIAADRQIARYTELTDLTLFVPGDDLVVTVDDVKR